MSPTPHGFQGTDGHVRPVPRQFHRELLVHSHPLHYNL